jgi:50S ribosomal protein L16 3-hydroxylase
MKPVERLEPFDAERFLQEFWHRRPCLISGWLDPEGLTLAELIDAADRYELPTRLITGTQERSNWTLSHGPIDTADLPDQGSDWTILVQEMDKIHSGVETVMQAFRRFLPDWMLDDIMISHAMPGGSVGAHVDAYDVFLVQVTGRRCWQLATEFDPTLDERFEMALLSHWHPQSELVAEPGDILYLPAGVAHHGVADNECQTWSVGLRTPSGPELMFYLAESLTCAQDPGPRLKVGIPDAHTPAHITPEMIHQTRTLLEDTLKLDDDEIGRLLGRVLSSWRLWPRDEGEEDPATIRQQLNAGATIKLDAGARIAVCNADGPERLFVNGEAIDCPPELARRLASSRVVDRDWLDHDLGLEQLIECGALPGPES